MTDPNLPQPAAGSDNQTGQAWPGSMTDEIDLAVWRLDLNHRVIELNRAGRRLFGLIDADLSAADPINDVDWRSAFHPDDLSQVQSTLLAATGSRDEVACDLRIRANEPSGFRWFRLGARARRPDGQDPIGWTCFARDIHGLFLARTALQQSERLLKVTFGAGPMGSWRYVRGEPSVEVDEFIRKLWGLPQGQGSVLLTDLIASIHPADRDQFVMFSEKAWQSGSLDGTFRFRRPDGELRWQRSIGVLVPDPGSGRPALIGVSTDVTERQQAREALRISSQRLKIALGVSKVLLYTMDRDLRYTWLYSPDLNLEHLIGKRDDERSLSREEASELTTFKQSVLDSGVAAQRAFVLTIDGEVLHIESSIDPVRDEDGRIQGLAAAVFNVTKRRRAEIALGEANQRKNDFLAVLSHELRNPLAPIRNALALIRESDSQEVRERTLPIIERQVRQIGRLVDDLLDVSRLTNGRLTLRHEPVDMTEFLRYFGSAQALVLASKGQRIELTLPDSPLVIEGDRGRIGQVMVNLVSNASKFSPRGAAILLDARAEGTALVIRVRDSGIGIAADQLERIFEKFAQLPLDAGMTDDGLGIGLHLARELVSMHGGSIEARSAGTGQGSEFIVRLPLSERDVPQQAAVLAHAAPPAALSVLVVDDNSDIIETMTLLLQDWGYRTLSATDGEAGLALAEAQRPDIVLMDIGMPRMDGYEMARRIRALPGGKAMTLIAVSGWGQAGDLARSREAGIDEHLLKPVDPARLREVLERSVVA
jgi:signal transduction histidine kinase/ActR/RegA family two-component response regulator